MTNISIISGSHRKNSQSSKVARAVAVALADQGICPNPWEIDLSDNPLPLWEESIWEKDPRWEERLTPLRAKLNDSDGFVVISPEWSGMVPPGLKNFFLMCASGELAHKPALLIGVSAGAGGAYPIAELRQSSYKNTRICYLPEHLIVRYVEHVLNEDSQANDPQLDQPVRARMCYALNLLGEYCKAFHAIRKSAAASLKEFPHGM